MSKTRRNSGGKGKNKGHRRNFGKKPPKAKRRKTNHGGTTLKGLLRIGPRGRGHVAVENPPFPLEEEVLIEHNFLHKALNGDIVEIRLHGAQEGSTPRGEVVNIVERARKFFVGRFEQNPGKNASGFLIPDDRKLYKDIFIPRDGLTVDGQRTKDGDKVLVEITKWRSETENPEGHVVKILGKPGNHEVEIQSILLEKGIDYTFPKAAEREAAKIRKEYAQTLRTELSNSKAPTSDGLGRRDMRDVPTFTIDPKTAKDFDDAISFRKLVKDVYEVGIHIADVSFFVRPGTKLDEEASKRANSVYLVDRTIPMLPEELSNDICSLVEGEDRLTYSAVFTMTTSGKIKRSWFGHTIIHSDKRFTYEEAQRVLDKKRGPFHTELAILNKIAKGYKKIRAKEGSISFETDEVKITLDDKQKPIKIEVKERIPTQMLIEEFMLLANREVATFLGKLSKNKGGGSLYRVHPLPDAEKIADLDIFIRAMGYDLINKDGKVNARDINNLLRQIEGKPEEDLIQTAVLRSMSKAVYSTKNIGHFGIGFGFYTHFTSPIRRYADLLVHRVLDRYLSGKTLSKKQLSEYRKDAEYISNAERDAERAERESIKFKQAEYMQNHIGKKLCGTISGVVEWGLYVEEEETKAEGLVPIRTLEDDYYQLDGKNFQIVGSRSKKRYRLGDKVCMKVVSADPERRQIDYKLV